jgi:hypothetical protein
LYPETMVLDTLVLARACSCLLFTHLLFARTTEYLGVERGAAVVLHAVVICDDHALACSGAYSSKPSILALTEPKLQASQLELEKKRLSSPAFR